MRVHQGGHCHTQCLIIFSEIIKAVSQDIWPHQNLGESIEVFGWWKEADNLGRIPEKKGEGQPSHSLIFPWLWTMILSTSPNLPDGKFIVLPIRTLYHRAVCKASWLL